MKSSNPVLGKAFGQPSNNQVELLESTFNAPAASSIRTGRMTIEDVIAKTGFLFTILVVVGAFAWNANLGQGSILIGFLGGFGLAMVISFSKKIRPPLVIAYAAFEGSIGYFIIGLVSLITSFFGVGQGRGFYGVSGLGLLLAVAGVALASFFLVLDFDQIQRGVNSGVPEQESWRASFGLMVTIVWLYLEVLRLLSILRNSR